MTRRILVVGDVMTDIIVRPEGPIVPGSDRSATIRNRPGGSGANQAVWLGAAGAEVVFAARVGAGERDMYANYFRGFGVVPVLAADRDLPSGVLVTVLDPSGERSFLTDRGANLNLCADDLPDALLSGIGLIMVSGYSLFAPGPRAAVQRLLQVARREEVAIAIDPASIGFLADVGPQTFLDWVGPCDWIFANESEAALLSGEDEPAVQMRALGAQFAQVVIKRGRAGATLGGSARLTLSQTAPEVEVVDTTGAGDAFAAGFLARLMAGDTQEACLAAGISNGARAVQMVGGQPQ